MKITLGRLLLATSLTLVPASLALLYLLVELTLMLAPSLRALAEGSYDGLKPYLALVLLGSSLFLLLIYSLEQIAGYVLGLGAGPHMVKIKAEGAKPYGFTTGGLSRWISFVVLGGGEDPELERFVELHEEAHAKFKHPAKIWIVGAVMYGEMSALPSTYVALGQLPQYIYVFSVALVATTAYMLFVLVRALEVEADIYVFKNMGLKSHDLFVKLMKIRYGSWRQPLRSRLTHAQGEFVLLLGDPIAAHAPWEHLLLLSAASATVLLPKLAATFQPAYQNPVAYYLLLLLGSLILNYFLSLIGEYTLRRIVRAKLTDRGYTNLARLTVSASFLMISLASLVSFPTSIVIIILGFYIVYKIVNIYIRNIYYVLIVYLIIAMIAAPWMLGLY